MDNLHIFTDIVVAGVIFFSILFAYHRGLCRELFALVAWIGAAYITVKNFHGASLFARKFISVDIIADLTAGATVFLGALILISLVTHFIAYQIQNSSFGPIDRSLGIFYGAVRGGIILCLAYFALLAAVPGKHYPTWLTKARSFPYIEKTTYGLMELTLPHVKGTEFGDMIGDSLKMRDGKPLQSIEEKTAERVAAEHPEIVKEEAAAPQEKPAEPEKTEEKKVETKEVPAKSSEDKKPEPKAAPEGYGSEAREELDKLMEETKQ